MSTITFLLKDGNLVAINNETGFPETIRLDLDGLKKVKQILHETDEKLIDQYNKRRAVEFLEQQELRYRAEADRIERQKKELEELF